MVDLQNTTDCKVVLERLLKAAADPIKIAGAVIQVSASIGVTLYPLDSVDSNQLMHHADQAMYSAKQAGKTVIFYLIANKIARFLAPLQIICIQIMAYVKTANSHNHAVGAVVRSVALRLAKLSIFSHNDGD